MIPDDVVKMPLAEFEATFGFRPLDALEKKWFAVMGTRISEDQRAVIDAGIIEAGNLDDVVMD